MFKKIKYQIADGYVVDTYEDKNMSLLDILEILKNPNVINFSAVNMTTREYFKSISKSK